MYISRFHEVKLKDLTRFFPILLLTGARQTGKTTLLKHVLAEFTYVSLDLPSLAEQAEHAPKQFLEKHPLPLLIDEVQYAPALFRYLKHVVDQQPDMAGQFVLTGSQKFTLMQGITESLAGRCVWLELEGLSHREV